MSGKIIDNAQCRQPSQNELRLASGAKDHHEFLDLLADQTLFPQVVDIRGLGAKACPSEFIGGLPPVVIEGLADLEITLTAADANGDGFVSRGEAEERLGAADDRDFARFWASAAAYTEVLVPYSENPGFEKGELARAWVDLNDHAAGLPPEAREAGSRRLYGIPLAGFPTPASDTVELERLTKSGALQGERREAADLILRSAAVPMALTPTEVAAYAALNADRMEPAAEEIAEAAAMVTVAGEALTLDELTVMGGTGGETPASMGLLQRAAAGLSTAGENAFLTDWMDQAYQNQAAATWGGVGGAIAGAYAGSAALSRVLPQSGRWAGVKSTGALLALELGLGLGMNVAGGLMGEEEIYEYLPGAETHPLYENLKDLGRRPFSRTAEDGVFFAEWAAADWLIQNGVKRAIFARLLGNRCGGSVTNPSEAWKAFDVARRYVAGNASRASRWAKGGATAGLLLGAPKVLPEEAMENPLTTVGLIGGAYAINEIGTLWMNDWIGQNGGHFCGPRTRSTGRGDGWEPGGPRGRRIRFAPDFSRVRLPEQATVETAGKAAAAVGAGYLIYRGIRMVPSLFPALWPTIPANAAIP